jgi:integrase
MEDVPMDAVREAVSRTSKLKPTRRAVDAAVANHRPGRRERHWFTDPIEMYLQITPKGCASYCLRFEKPEGGKGDFTIGKVSRITPEMATEAARVRLAGLTLHSLDPVEARRAARTDAKTKKLRTFATFADAFMSAPENRIWSRRTAEGRQWLLEKYILPRIGQRPVTDLKRVDVKECVRAIQAIARSAHAEVESSSGNRTANMCHALIKGIFNWAINEDRCEVNPAAFRKLFDDMPVRRVGALNDERLRIIWQALEDEDAKGWGSTSVLAIQLVILTLQRPNEIVHAHQDDFDWNEAVWRIPESRTKTNSAYEVPLTDHSVALFQRAFKLSQSPWAFPAEDRKGSLRPGVLSQRFEKLRHRLVKAGRLPNENVQLYDGRRFGRTRLVQGLGVPEHIAERVINHAPDRSMARRYDVGDYSGEIRRAHEAWTQELRRIVHLETQPSQ